MKPETMPTSAQIRVEANKILEVLEERDLAIAVQSGNRLQSYTPYVEWLKNGDQSKLYLRQLAETVVFELQRLNATSELKVVHDWILRGLLK